MMLALTFAICACGVSLLSTGATIPLARVVVVTSCNLKLVVLFSADSSLAHVVGHTLQLALVVLFYQPTGATTVLALGQLALCGGGKYIYIPLSPPYTTATTTTTKVVMHAFNTCATALGKITDHTYCGPGHPSDHAPHVPESTCAPWLNMKPTSSASYRG